MRMIDRPSILITSIGRTGTEFFARFFAHMMPEAMSLHEPDIFQNAGVANRTAAYLRQVRLAGAWRMVFLKSLGQWTLAKLSDSRFLGRTDVMQAARGLRSHRQAFIRKLPGSAYVEGNFGYYGLVDVAPHVFTQHRIIYLVRDGREWVRSHMNWGEAYGKRGARRLISHNWPSAADVRGDPYAFQWARFSRFEQLCWAWSSLNAYALKTLPENPDARLFRFEELFSGETRYQVLHELVDFATSLPALSRRPRPSLDGWLERRSHTSAGGFPGWQEWTSDQRAQFEGLCGPLMAELRYW